VILALDVPALQDARVLATRTSRWLGAVKIGSQLFTAEGPAAVRAMHDLGLRVFLDLKFHDIPNTVGAAVSAAGQLGVWMLNVHGSGGAAVLEAAARAAAAAPGPRPLVIAVTVLTSLTEAELQATLGTSRTLAAQVEMLARGARAAGLDGVVASPHEIGMIRAACGPAFVIVTPGVRPAGAERQDQRRVMTPGEAMRAGRFPGPETNTGPSGVEVRVNLRYLRMDPFRPRCPCSPSPTPGSSTTCTRSRP
jgi:orotidine-5'-phosphate decarboxylase